MSHELTMSRGVAEMAYAGETPWHGLGQQLTKGASIEEWTAAAGMAWKIQRSKVRYFADREGSQQFEWPANNVLFRSDTKAPLGIVSPAFKVVQPVQVLEFFRDMVADQGFELETAGTLFGGRRFWALASIGEKAAILNKEDIVGGYLLLCTGADGTLATTAKFTTVRVVCNNTLSMSLGSAAGSNEVSVTHRSRFDPAAVKDQLGIARGFFAAFVNGMQMLASTKTDYEAAGMLTADLLRPVVQPGTDPIKVIETDARVAGSKNFKSIMSLFAGKGKGARMGGVADTAWGWVNAVTEHVDYVAVSATNDNRLDSAWFGRGDALKTKAVELAHAFATR